MFYMYRFEPHTCKVIEAFGTLQMHLLLFMDDCSAHLFWATLSYFMEKLQELKEWFAFKYKP